MRTEIPIVVLDGSGNALPGASVMVTIRGGGGATVYASETGATTLANPLLTDAGGRVSGWLDRGAYDATITAPGLATYHEYFDSTPASDGAVDTAWLADSVVTAQKILNGAVDGNKIGAGAVAIGHLVAAVQAALVPVGALLPFAGLTAPTGFLLCDGSNVDSAAYPQLDALIGAAAPAGATHAYNGGASPAAGKFKLPDMKGRSAIGSGAGAGLTARTLGQSGGAETVVLGTQHLPPHTHTNPNISFPTSAIGESAGMYHRWGAGDIGVGDNSFSNGNYVIGQGATGNGPGTSTGVPNVHPFTVTNHIIRAA